MAIIELNLEKPALKRVESLTDQRIEDEQLRAEPASERSEETSQEMESEFASEQDTSGGRSRPRKYGRRLAILGGTAAGVAAARKLRQRRKSGSEQQELEEDWQTAE